MTRIWEVEVSGRDDRQLHERIQVSATNVADAIKRATKRQLMPRSTRITKVTLIAEAD